MASGQEAILSGEKSAVTVLVTDLRGFTGFAEKLPAEEVVAILNDHFDLLVGIIARHGGFVGSTSWATQSSPSSARPAATRITRRARWRAPSMQRPGRPNDENRVRGWPLMEMGAGINTGPAVVGNMGSFRRIKYGVVGPVVNAAARIEALTVGGQVLVADATRQALGDLLVVDGPFEAEATGVEGVMRLWEVLAPRGERMLVLPSAGARPGRAAHADRG